MVKDSLVALADDFGVAGGAAFFMAGAGDWAGADFGGVCAFAADVINTVAAAMPNSVEIILR